MPLAYKQRVCVVSWKLCLRHVTSWKMNKYRARQCGIPTEDMGGKDRKASDDRVILIALSWQFHSAAFHVQPHFFLQIKFNIVDSTESLTTCSSPSSTVLFEESYYMVTHKNVPQSDRVSKLCKAILGFDLGTSCEILKSAPKRRNGERSRGR